MRDTITDSEKTPELEEWQSKVRGVYTVARWNADGEREQESVYAGDIFHILPKERERNQRTIRDKRDDPFTNGAFRMRAPAEGNEASEALAHIAHGIEDDELQGILDSTFSDFEGQVASLKESVTVERLYRMAREQEAGGRKITVITARLKALDPHAVVIGDNLGAGRENPDDQRDGPAAVIALEEESAPRQYAGVDS